MSLEFSLSDNLTMINRLIIVLGRKFCLSPNANARKGGLLGLGAVMVGFKNGTVSKIPPEVVEEIVRPILTCLSDPDARVRYYACESLYNVTKVASVSILPLFADIFDNMSKLVADSDISVRSGVEVLDKLLKDIVTEVESPVIEPHLPKLEEYIYAKNPFTRMFIISWVRVLDSKVDMIEYLPRLLDGMFCCLCDSTEEIRAFTIGLLSEFLNKIVMSPADRVDISSLVSILLKHAKNENENENENFVQYTAIAWLRQLSSLMDEADLKNYTPGILSAILPCLAFQQPATDESIVASRERHATNMIIQRLVDTNSDNDASVSHFLGALCEVFRDNEAIFDERGTYVILNLCSIIKPETIYRSFADLVKDEKVERKFVYNLIQKLNHILFTTQPLSSMRLRLGTSEEDPEVSKLFQSLYTAWRVSPIAALTLCLLTNNYKNACEIVTALSQSDITLDTLTQIDWVVQLIESPVFAPLRMRMLDTSNNHYLLQALYGILMILPQSEAYRKLGSRLDQVYKFTSSQIQPKVAKPVPPVSHNKFRVGKDLDNSEGKR